MYRGIVAAVFAFLATGVWAQVSEWQFRSFDDGSFFSAAISPTDRPGLALLCGERSPTGLSALQTGNMEPDITRPDSYRLYLGENDIGAYEGYTETRQDVLIVIGTTGYRVPVVRWNELFGTWEADLPANDPVFAALAEQPAFELRSQAGSPVVTTNGFGRALTRLGGHCQTMFTAIGLPWRTVAAAPAPRPDMQQLAEAAIQTGCGGPAIMGPKTIQTGEIDGDGQPDVVVFWDGITCSGGYPRPFCGASMCSVQLFVSSLFARRGKPEELLAQSVWLQPLTNGNSGVVTVGSLATCQGRGNCEFLWYWNGTDIVQLQ